MIKEYKNQILYFIKSKKYIIPVLIVTILSFGFVITHESIGMDDLSIDKYASGMYWLSAKRFGMFLIYNILNIKEFTPFWLDFVVALFMPLIAIVFCAFIKKNFTKLIKSDFTYTVFSCLFISNPLINHFYIYQASNISIVISNLVTIFLGIVVYETFFHQKNKKNNYVIVGLVMGLVLSTYESCAQTFLAFTFIAIFLKTILEKEKNENKDLVKYFIVNVITLIIGIIFYILINWIIKLVLMITGNLTPDFASNGTLLFTKEFFDMANTIKGMKLKQFFDSIFYDIIGYLPMIVFTGALIIILILEIIQLIKRKNYIRFFSLLGVIFSSFIITVLQLKILYRIQFSLILVCAFLCSYIYNYFCTKKTLKYILNIIIIFLVIYQSKTLNQYFYNDYQRSEREKYIINNIAVEIVNKCDYENKPLVFYIENNLENVQQKYFRINEDNSISIIIWGLGAFKEPQTELIKYINYFGYDFKFPTKNDVNESNEEYENLSQDKKENIVEFENYIVVNLDKYDMFKSYINPYSD